MAAELFFVLPLLLILTLGMVGLADLLIAEQLVTEASGRGARVIALGGTEDQAKDAIQAVIGPDRTDKANIVFVTTTDDGQPIPPGGLIEVRIELETQYATVTQFAPVASDDLVIGRTVMQRE
jgi:Flp pilus assembly protein TadG